MSTDVLKRHNVTMFGSGSQPIVFAHGLACDQSVWRFLTPAFEEKYKIVLFDYIGCGRSDLSSYNKEKYSTLQGYADDVLEICDKLNLSKVIFVGHSVSSMIGLLAAIAAPGLFSEIIMIGPSPRYINDKGYFGGFERDEIEELLYLMKNKYIEWAGYFAPTAMGNAERPELGEGLKNSFCLADPFVTHEFARVTFLSDNRKDLNALKTPSLILQLAEDIVAPNQVGEYMHKNTPGSTLVFMEATGHFPHLSAPEETIRLIKKYLEKE